MNAALIVLFAILCVGLLAAGLARRGAIFEYPFLAGAMMFVFVLPQLPGLSSDIFLPRNGFAVSLLFTIACLAAVPLGWRLSSHPMTKTVRPLDEGRLLVASAILSVGGAGFYAAVGRLPPETMVSVALSGWPVLLLFFSKMLICGFAIAALCAARRPSAAAITILVFDAAIYLDRLYVTGKRGEALEFLLVIALALWFQRGRALPRVVVIAVLLVGAAWLTSAKDYREVTRRGEQPTLADIATIDVAGNFNDQLTDGGVEFRNAIVRMDFTSRTRAFDYGLFHWNELVMAFVPAQLVGQRIKRSLMVDVPGAENRFYEPKFGSTETGMADAFSSFWYFGFVKFLFVAWAMRRIYRSAMAGDASWQVVYMLSAVPAMHVFSHHTNWILTSWIQLALFLAPALIYARSSGSRASPAAAAA